METYVIVNEYFELDAEVIKDIEAEAKGPNQHELDTRLSEIRQRQMPGLKSLLRQAVISGDYESLSGLAAAARRQARDAAFRKAARAAVQNYSKIGETRNWHR